MVEPQFVIKASDRFAVEIIRRHRHFCVLYGLREQALEDMKALEEMQQWQMDNPERVHYPDHKHVPASPFWRLPPMQLIVKAKPEPKCDEPSSNSARAMHCELPPDHAEFHYGRDRAGRWRSWVR